MRLVFHGAASEVGRSCIEIETQGDRYILDCGVKFITEGFLYPEGIFNYEQIDGVLISHAHLDHTGALPLFEHHNIVCPVFMTHQTLALTKILLKDSYKIARIKHLHPAYERIDIKSVVDRVKRVEFDKWYRHRKLKFMYLNAGHIPGSAMILLEVEGKRILYTGDFNTRTTKLMKPARVRDVMKHGRVDVVITESTYGHRELPARAQVEKDFLAAIKQVRKKGGKILVPVFAVGRAQEILIMLSKIDWDCPMYFDGMAKEITRKVLTHQSTYVTNKDTLHEMFFNKVRTISSERSRNRIAEQDCGMFITTSGMLQGGPAIHYLKHMWHNPNDAVFLTGYQAKGTNGRRLLEDGIVFIKGMETPVRCQVKKFDFSGHADIEDVHMFIQKLDPSVVIAQHGDPESVAAMEEWARTNTRAETYAPTVGDEIDL